MLTSEKIDQIAAALNKAQAVMENAKKTEDNPFFKMKYADLAEVWDTARKPLADNGLSIVQSVSSKPETFRLKTPTDRQPDKESNMIWLTVTTRLLHTSEQWFEDSVSMPVEADPQSLGKNTTYIRRYALMAMVGISPEDDDGEQAVGRGKQSGEGKQTDKKPEATRTGNTTPTEHFCKVHNVPFFKRGTMKSYAHPIEGTNEWCNESDEVEKELKGTPPASGPVKMRTQEQVDKIKEAGKFHDIPAIINGLGINATKPLTYADAERVLTEVEKRATK